MRHAGRIGTVLWLLAAAFVRFTQACFPVDEVLAFDTPWKQRTSLSTYVIMVADIEDSNKLYLKYYTEGVLTGSRELECLMAHGNYKYLVREDNPSGVIHYSCLHIEQKVAGIIHTRQTSENTSRKKVHCVNDDYTEDEFIWFANVRHSGVSCPLTGGYQLIISADNMALSSHCVNSIHTFNPRMQFECDNSSSGQVLLDMGDACMFRQLWEKAIIVKRDFVFLRCLGHWAEGAKTTLVLQVVENEDYIWCLQYQLVLPLDGFTPMYLSVVGYCPSKVFESNTAVYDSLYTVYGALAAYKPYGHWKCAGHAVKTGRCQEDSRACLRSNQCPAACNRCVKVRPRPGCGFHEKFHGTWKPLSWKLNVLVSVSNDSLRGVYGRMECRGPPTLYKKGDYAYELEQVGSAPTCMPFYACVRLNLLAQGIMFFQFQTVGRRQSTGEPYSCVEANERWGHLGALYLEKPMVLYQRSKLVGVSCNFTDNALYRTSLQDCRLVIRKCTGYCTTLRVDLDSDTCSNETIASHPISSEHKCLQTMRFGDNVVLLLTEKSISSNDRYHCWIFASAMVFVVSPEDCHEKEARRIVDIVGESVALYDPVIVLSTSHRNEMSTACDKRPSVGMTLSLLVLAELLSSCIA